MHDDEELVSSISSALNQRSQMLELQNVVEELKNVFLEAASKVESDLALLEDQLENLHPTAPTNTDQAKEQLQKTDCFMTKVQECESELQAVQVGKKLALEWKHSI